MRLKTATHEPGRGVRDARPQAASWSPCGSRCGCRCGGRRSAPPVARSHTIIRPSTSASSLATFPATTPTQSVAARAGSKNGRAQHLRTVPGADRQGSLRRDLGPALRVKPKGSGQRRAEVVPRFPRARRCWPISTAAACLLSRLGRLRVDAPETAWVGSRADLSDRHAELLAN